MTSPAPSSSWLRPALVLVLSAVIGLLVLPQLGTSVRRIHPLVGLPAPRFSLPILSGGEAGNRISLAALSGHVVVLDFWASWCQPCTIQSEILRRVAQLPASQSVIFVGINTADDPERARRFAQEHQLPYATVLDTDSISNQYAAHTLPTLVIVDGKGIVSHIESRVMREGELVDAIALAAKGVPLAPQDLAHERKPSLGRSLD